MDDAHFDALARTFADVHTRRGLTRLFSGAALAVPLTLLGLTGTAVRAANRASAVTPRRTVTWGPPASGWCALRRWVSAEATLLSGGDPHCHVSPWPRSSPRNGSPRRWRERRRSPVQLALTAAGGDRPPPYRAARRRRHLMHTRLSSARICHDGGRTDAHATIGGHPDLDALQDGGWESEPRYDVFLHLWFWHFSLLLQSLFLGD